jgi:peptidoglycan hydrolase-like protein with peptidoglycan-binding domain
VDVQHNLEAHDTRHAHPADSHGHGTANSSEHENSHTGEHTTEAVQAFQAAYGLNVTGHIDEANLGTAVSPTSRAAASPATTRPDRPTADRLIELCLHHVNDTYDLGTSADHHDPDVHLFDCAELISWACAQIGVPNIPSYSGGIWDACARAGHTMSPDTAGATSAARCSTGRPAASTRTATWRLSLGTGRDTIER